VTGLATSRGCLACGVVPTDRTESWLERYLVSRTTIDSPMVPKMQSFGTSNSGTANTTSLRLLALDGISDTANMGSLIRTAAALGVDVILLSAHCCDAWYRRAVRVSMGHVFGLPLVRVAHLDTTIATLRRQWNVTSYAAVVDPMAKLRLADLQRGMACKRTAHNCDSSLYTSDLFALYTKPR
jgi:tRNA G18 (ribose-2'-O)-methylase SpoU